MLPLFQFVNRRLLVIVIRTIRRFNKLPRGRDEICFETDWISVLFVIFCLFIQDNSLKIQIPNLSYPFFKKTTVLTLTDFKIRAMQKSRLDSYIIQGFLLYRSKHAYEILIITQAQQKTPFVCFLEKVR